jgi:signal transduction histidine kinase
VSFEPTRELPPVIASRDFIQQILLNFIFNAAESLAEKKEVVVTTSSYKIVPSGPVLLPNPAPAYVTIAVRDYGCGIPLENMSRIFEPFFTTKAFSARRGTGLGLSMVYELAKKIGAGLAVESELEKGSTFILILPVVEEPLAKPQSSVENPNVSNES